VAGSSANARAGAGKRGDGKQRNKGDKGQRGFQQSIHDFLLMVPAADGEVRDAHARMRPNRERLYKK
jgi:hypothetical protein